MPMNVIDDHVGVAMPLLTPTCHACHHERFYVNLTNYICYFYIKLYVEK